MVRRPVIAPLRLPLGYSQSVSRYILSWHFCESARGEADNKDLVTTPNSGFELSASYPALPFCVLRSWRFCKHFVLGFASGKDIGHQVQNFVLGHEFSSPVGIGETFEVSMDLMFL